MSISLKRVKRCGKRFQ